MPLDPCPGCGARFAPAGTVTHAYMESSPGCWAMYGEVLAREYSDATYFAVHRLSVEAYAAQHPGRPSPQSIQSVALHLISLCLVLEHGVDPAAATRAIQSAAKDKTRFCWLTPPEPRGRLTVADVHRAATGEEHGRAVREWAAGVWSAWAVHHETIRSWLPHSYLSGVAARTSR